MSEHFRFRIECDVELSNRDIWPDGDAPENPTVEDVVARVKQSTHEQGFVRDWNMPIDVTVDGKLVWP